MEVIRTGSDSFKRLWQELWEQDTLQIPYFSTSWVPYYTEYHDDGVFNDKSFVIVDNKVPLIGLNIGLWDKKDGSQKLSGVGTPVAYLKTYGNYSMTGAERLLRKEVDGILSQFPKAYLHYLECLNDGELSFFGGYLLDKGAVATPVSMQMIDLALSEDDLYLGVRKSYKSLINWGAKNINLQLIDSENVTPDLFEQFRQLHIKVAGRETRSKATWGLQYYQVKNREAFVLLGELEGVLVTAALFQYTAKNCFYGVSVSKRELFDKPMSHNLLWQAILHAKRLGCQYFEPGPLYYPGHSTPKEVGISKFKKGFGGSAKVRMDIKKMGV